MSEDLANAQCVAIYLNGSLVGYESREWSYYPTRQGRWRRIKSAPMNDRDWLRAAERLLLAEFTLIPVPEGTAKAKVFRR